MVALVLPVLLTPSEKAQADQRSQAGVPAQVVRELLIPFFPGPQDAVPTQFERSG
jgi:hypothetical protein